MSNAVNDYKKKVIEQTEKEFELFKEKMLQQTKEDIFYHNYEIHVKTELKEVIVNECIDKYLYPILHNIGEDLLDYLYNEFLSNEYASVNTFDDTEDFIAETMRYWLETAGE